MRIKFKLFATLQHLLPADAVNHTAEIEVAEDVTLHQVIDMISVKRADAHLVLVNGHDYDCESRDEPNVLVEGDVVAVWPNVAGG